MKSMVRFAPERTWQKYIGLEAHAANDKCADRHRRAAKGACVIPFAGRRGTIALGHRQGRGATETEGLVRQARSLAGEDPREIEEDRRWVVSRPTEDGRVIIAGRRDPAERDRDFRGNEHAGLGWRGGRLRLLCRCSDELSYKAVGVLARDELVADGVGRAAFRRLEARTGDLDRGAPGRDESSRAARLDPDLEAPDERGGTRSRRAASPAFPAVVQLSNRGIDGARLVAPGKST